MADANNAGSGAKDEGTTEEQNPFASFNTEGFQQGERIEEKDDKAADPPAKAPTDTAAEKKTEPADEQDDELEDEDDREGADREDDEDKSKEGKPTKKTARSRINELTRQRYDAERRAEAAERRLAQLEGREDPDDKDAAAADAQKPERKDGKPKNAPPNPEDEKYPFGEIDPKYIADLARYHTKEAMREAREEAALEEQEEQELEHQRTVQQKFQDQVKAGQEKYDDFHEKVVEGAENDEWLLSRELAEMIVESSAGADIAYHLASHPEEAAQIYRQTPLEQARYFGKMEAKFSATQAAATDDKSEEPEKPKLPKAPPPVDGQPRGRAGRFTTSPDTSDFPAFEKMAMGRK